MILFVLQRVKLSTEPRTDADFTEMGKLYETDFVLYQKASGHFSAIYSFFDYGSDGGSFPARVHVYDRG